MEFLFLICSVNSCLKLRQVVIKFVFLVQYLISSIWLKAHFLKPSFVLQKLLIFHGIFPPKVLLAAVFKNSGFFPRTLLGQSKNNADLLSNIVMCHDLMYKQNPLWQKNTCTKISSVETYNIFWDLTNKETYSPLLKHLFQNKKERIQRVRKMARLKM